MSNTIDLEGFIVRKIIAVTSLTTASGSGYICSNRKACALVLKINGMSTYRTKTGSFILDPHHIMLLLRNSEYDVSYIESGKFYMVEFECDPDYTGQGICSLYIKNTTILYNLFISLEREWTFKKHAHISKCMSLLYEILNLLEQNQTKSYISDSKLAIIQPSVKYLEKNYSDPELDVDTLAHQSNIGTSYFRRLFTSAYMAPPAKYLRKIRISKARDLLISMSHSIGEIAGLVGYTNIYYFSNAFKKETGISPTEFLRQYLRNK